MLLSSVMTHMSRFRVSKCCIFTPSCTQTDRHLPSFYMQTQSHQEQKRFETRPEKCIKLPSSQLQSPHLRLLICIRWRGLGKKTLFWLAEKLCVCLLLDPGAVGIESVNELCCYDVFHLHLLLSPFFCIKAFNFTINVLILSHMSLPTCVLMFLKLFWTNRAYTV